MTDDLIVTRSDDGTILVGSPATADLGRFQTVPLVGGSAVVDVRRPHGLPLLRIHDYSAAAWWLDLLVDDRTSRDITQLEGRDVPESEEVAPVEEDLDAPDLLTPLNRLAVGLWVRRWWPARTETVRIDETLLELEIGTLAWRCEHLLGGLGLAEDVLAPHVVALDHSAEAALDDADAPVGLLVPALRATIESVVVDDTQYQRLRELEGELRHVAAGRRELLDDRLRRSLELFALQSPQLVHLGRSSAGTGAIAHAPVRGAGAADPRQLDPRTVSHRDDAVRWELSEDDDGTTISVQVLGAEGAVGRTPLAAVYIGEGLPAVVVALERVDDAFEGTAPLGEWPSADRTPFVVPFHPDRLVRPDPSVAARLRSSVRDTVRVRAEHYGTHSLDRLADVLALEPDVPLHGLVAA